MAAAPRQRASSTSGTRHLVVILGDQLDRNSSALDDFDPKTDRVWMAEVSGEAKHVWSHKARIALFISVMRHFARDLEKKGFPVHYRRLDDPANRGTLAAELGEAIRLLRPQRLVVVEPGEYRVAQALKQTASRHHIPLDIRPDRHFLCSTDDFAAFAEGRRQLRQEHFYQRMRKQTGILMTRGQPLGGAWNYDKENRQAFDRSGPGKVPAPRSFQPDAITREVLRLVKQQFPDHPGSLDRFDWPVTPTQARAALADFISHRLKKFGPHQDAMWTEQPFLYHARLSSAMNLKLLDPREAITAARQALDQDQAPLPSVEGFIRQILGWREYVRGIYTRFMPEYSRRNALQASLPLPSLYWTGQTELACLREAVGQTLALGYAHHIQRLMVTGLYGLLLGVDPAKLHEWYLAIYVDAVEWVELPNTLGMSQFADGGVMASKPYAATGKYIDRMSDYCRHCPCDPNRTRGDTACPFTTLYWDFLGRHEKTLKKNPRMGLQLRNLQRLDRAEKQAIRRQADGYKAQA